MATSETTINSNLATVEEKLPTVYILKGLPASGKTTHAKEILNKNPNKYVRVNKDDLRAMMFDSKFSKPNESVVLKVRDSIILNAIKAGRHVIVDDTNLNPIHERQIKGLVFGMAKVAVIMLDVPLEVALENNANRTDLLATGDPHKVPTQAIKGM